MRMPVIPVGFRLLKKFEVLDEGDMFCRSNKVKDLDFSNWTFITNESFFGDSIETVQKRIQIRFSDDYNYYFITKKTLFFHEPFNLISAAGE